MSAFEALFLGVVQGLTEFLPVSSDGHLALAEWAIGLRPSLAFNVLLHLGTLGVVVVVLRREVVAMVRGTIGMVVRRLADDADRFFALSILVASLATAILGLALRRTAEAQTESPRMVAVWLAVTGLLLLTTLRRKGERTMRLEIAFAIGVAQGLAVLPGLSRSGATIATALLFGLRREDAARFSFAASIPAVAGALALEAPKLGATEIHVLPAVIGVLAAAACGALALRAVFAAVGAGRIWAFSIYLFALAGVVLFF